VIDARAIIDPSARIADNVSIGPWTIIGPDVEIGTGTWVGPHVFIKGPTRIGENNKIYQFASVGEDPQDKKYNGEKTLLEIGDRNVIREFCTINRGTTQDNNKTLIGNDNLLMAYVHIAHDCIIGDFTVFSNNASLAGHVKVKDYVILGGFAGVHQYCTLGESCFVAKASIVGQDVLPFILVAGHAASACGLNSEGLRRRGFSNEHINILKRAYKLIYRKGFTVQQVIPQLQAMLSECASVQLMIDILEQTTRGIVR
jgi:UDP-N-acetylglucosamine acyltransferase